MNKQTEQALTEIHDAPSTVIEIPMPSKVTGYMAFYRCIGMTKWSDVYRLPQSESHPILPYNVFESRDDAIKAAMQVSYIKPVSIKVIAMEFEI